MADSSLVGEDAVGESPIPFFGVSSMDALSASIVMSKESNDLREGEEKGEAATEWKVAKIGKTKRGEMNE